MPPPVPERFENDPRQAELWRSIARLYEDYGYPLNEGEEWSEWRNKNAFLEVLDHIVTELLKWRLLPPTTEKPPENYSRPESLHYFGESIAEVECNTSDSVRITLKSGGFILISPEVRSYGKDLLIEVFPKGVESLVGP